MKQLQVILLLCLLTACANTPISSMWKLRNFDPLQANPSSIRLAVITNQIVILEDNSTTLGLAFSSEHPEHSFADTFYATVKPNAKVPELEHDKGINENITLFYLDETTANRMRLLQNRIKIIKEQNIKGEGSLSVNINTACFNGPKPDELDATIYARFSSEQGYIKLSSGIDLLAEAEKNDENLWIECGDIQRQ